MKIKIYINRKKINEETTARKKLINFHDQMMFNFDFENVIKVEFFELQNKTLNNKKRKNFQNISALKRFRTLKIFFFKFELYSEKNSLFWLLLFTSMRLNEIMKFWNEFC